jgi:hypothetical protein
MSWCATLRVNKVRMNVFSGDPIAGQSKTQGFGILLIFMLY